MFRQNHFFTALLFSIILIFSCNKSVVSDVQTNAIAEDSQEQQKSVEPHPYGGWYCPDNFGFSPVDIQHLEKVPVVIGRLPTKEETRNFISCRTPCKCPTTRFTALRRAPIWFNAY